GADDAAFLGANDRILSAAADFAPDAIIISAGWDAHRDDPLSRLDVSSAAFAELGLRYGALGLPTVIVQEGGYSLSAIEDVAPRFLAAFEEGRP
ncbi:MAG: histone deacetylase family protein, partial [Pseudomonadota bacterium]